MGKKLKQTIVKVATDAKVNNSPPLFGKIISDHTIRVKKVVDELKTKRVDFIFLKDLWKEVKASLSSKYVLSEAQMEDALNFMESVGDLNCFPCRQEGNPSMS